MSDILKQDIVGEQKAIDHYSEVLKLTESMGDYATTMMIEGILADEVSHIDEFAKIRRSTVRR